MRRWEGNNPVRLTLLHKTGEAVKEVASVALPAKQAVPLAGFTAKVGAGEELVLLPRPGGLFNGGDVTLRDLAVAFGAGGGTTWRLPQAWDGTDGGSAAGPIFPLEPRRPRP